MLTTIVSFVTSVGGSVVSTFVNWTVGFTSSVAGKAIIDGLEIAYENNKRIKERLKLEELEEERMAA